MKRYKLTMDLESARDLTDGDLVGLREMLTSAPGGEGRVIDIQIVTVPSPVVDGVGSVVATYGPRVRRSVVGALATKCNDCGDPIALIELCAACKAARSPQR